MHLCVSNLVNVKVSTHRIQTQTHKHIQWRRHTCLFSCLLVVTTMRVVVDVGGLIRALCDAVLVPHTRKKSKELHKEAYAKASSTTNAKPIQSPTSPSHAHRCKHAHAHTNTPGLPVSKVLHSWRWTRRRAPHDVAFSGQALVDWLMTQETLYINVAGTHAEQRVSSPAPAQLAWNDAAFDRQVFQHVALHLVCCVPLCMCHCLHNCLLVFVVNLCTHFSRMQHHVFVFCSCMSPRGPYG